MDKSFTSSFKSDDAVGTYLNNVYSPLSYDTFIWGIQKPRLRRIIESSFVNLDNLQHLDFACGTGRITEFLHSFVGYTTGVETSREMLNIARSKLDNVNFILGNLINNESLCKQKYDLITAFRFFLNAEPDLRREAMTALSKRLNEKNGRLIFNIHGNKYSLRHFAVILRNKNKGRVNEMSLYEVKQLVKEAGLEIENWYGFGIIPQFFYRTKLRPIISALDNFFSKLPFLKSISCDLLFVCKIKNPDGETI